MLTPEEAALLRKAVNAYNEAALDRESDAISMHRAINRQQIGHVTTPDEVRVAMEARGLNTEGVDFEKVAAAHNDDGRHVPGWEAPRVMPPSWREIVQERDDRGGAKYVNAAAKLTAILTCGFELDGRAWLHLSVSHRERVPTWGELRVAKEQFLGDREAYQVLPPRARYVNIHNNVLHLFALLDEEASALPDFTGGTGSL